MLNFLYFLGGLVLLLLGGRLLVSASVDTARKLNVSPLVVGLTLVAWGTSAPELALNLISAFKGRSDLAVGNVVGANICNMAFVLGVAALIKPLVVQERLIRVEIWLNAAILVGMAGLGLTVGFDHWTAGVMLLVFGLYSMWTIMSSLRDAKKKSEFGKAAEQLVEDTQTVKPMGWGLIGLFFAGGLLLLSIGGSLASDGASGIAIAFGLPAALVGVTIVAVGTTTPELATTLFALRKGETDLVLGNAIGSCLFNAGAIFGIVGVIKPPVVDGNMVLPLAYMGLLALVLIPISRTFGKTLSRVEGGLLLGSYGVFLGVSAWMALG